MNLRHLRTFRVIVSERSFSRAAERLGLTQPTVSAHVQELEAAVGGRLFERSAQGIALTQEGRALLGYAERILALCDEALRTIGDLQELATGDLSVAASSVPGHYFLPRPLAEFKGRFPGIGVRLTVSNSQEVRDAVRDGRVELGFLGEPARDDRLSERPVARDTLVAVVRPEHPLARRKEISLTELLAVPLIAREPGSATQRTLCRALERAGCNPAQLRIFMVLSSVEAVKQAVRAVDACAVVSVWSVADEVRHGLLRVLPVHDAALERYLYAVWRAHGHLAAPSSAFLDHLAEAHCPEQGWPGRLFTPAD